MELFSVKQIFKESIGVLLFATILSLVAGLFLRGITDNLMMITPLIILLPALNGMVGNYGIIMVSKFTTALYENKVNAIVFNTKFVKHLFKEILPIAILTAIYIAILATYIAYLKGFIFTIGTLWKIIAITLATTITLVLFEFVLSVIGGVYVYHKKMNPDDVLIPIITSIADLASIGIFSLLVILLF